ncbi:T9SS type A sorting domain-containing protein [Membranihabitans maritimus]|uniref:T9SS type A sorting domain-containing protein n=1 Tax=Membranihabitans maritimus TaxID=2904244 RepID=UPI001F44EAFD|nr:T9SS type A sorting domain-containing protein [Membranihabitans maritimus]
MYLKNYNNLRKSVFRIIEVFMIFGICTLSVQAQIFNDIITGDEVACPGTSNTYGIDMDVPSGTGIYWEIIEGEGEIMDSPSGESIEVFWNQDYRGITKIVLIGANFSALIGFQDTITVNVDKDLNRMNLNCNSTFYADFGPDCERYVDINEVISSGKIKCLDDFEFTLVVDNFELPNPVPQQFRGREIRATIRHKETGITCSSTLILEDNSAPELVCSNDSILCSDPRAYDPTNIEFGAPEVIPGCNEKYELKVNEYEWVDVDDHPDIEGFIERIWRVTDTRGNFNECADTIFLKKIVFDEILCPEDTSIICDHVDDLKDPMKTGTPTFNGTTIYSEDPYCKVYATYSDVERPGCGASMEVERTWRIVSYEDTGEELEMECVQIINVIDTVGPSIRFDSEQYVMEMHTDVDGLNSNGKYPTFYKGAVVEECRAEGDFPIPELIEDCSAQASSKISIKWGREGNEKVFFTDEENPDVRFRNLSIGKYLIEYSAYDDCNNFGKDTIVLVLEDKTPPAIVLKENVNVSLTGNESDIWVDINRFDEGTFDNCSMNILLARRVDWETACGYTADSTIKSNIRDRYDFAYKKFSTDSDSCLESIIEYGYSDEIPICCEDVCKDGVWVEFLAVDAFCNYSTLVAKVEVVDRSKPTVKAALPDITMNCYTYNANYRSEVDKGNLSVFGKYANSPNQRDTTWIDKFVCSTSGSTPYVQATDWIVDGYIMDNCKVNVSESVEFFLNECGEGWIERTFKVTDGCSGETDGEEVTTLLQKIIIEKDCRLRIEDFELPFEDTTVYNCSLEEIEAVGPQLKYPSCRDVGFAYTDEVSTLIEGEEGVCYKIIRTWEISDWCEEDPYYLPKFEQEIFIKNNNGPEILITSFADLCIEQGCTGKLDTQLEITDDCTAPEDLIINWTLKYSIDNGYEDVISGSGIHIERNDLSAGKYRLEVEVKDLCNNVVRKNYDFEVSYCESFSIDVPEVITVELSDVNEVLTKNEIKYRINHPCTDSDFTILIQYKGQGQVDGNGNPIPPSEDKTSLVYGCDQLGSNIVEIWVIDPNGIGIYKEFVLEVIDPNGVCPNSVSKIIGTISTPQGQPINDVSVGLMRDHSELKRNQTNISGSYDLGIFPNTNGNFIVKPDKNDNVSNGVSTFDALYIYRIASGKAQPKTMYEKYAADINDDGRITILDVIMVQKLVLNHTDQIPGRSWVFFNRKMEESSNISSDMEYKSMLHFIGVKKGDVNFSAKVRSKSRSASINQNISIKPITNKESITKLPVYLDNVRELESMQFSLVNNSGSDWMGIESDIIGIQPDDFDLTNEGLSISWFNKSSEPVIVDGQPVFYIILQENGEKSIDTRDIFIDTKVVPEFYADNTMKESMTITIEKGAGDVNHNLEISEPYPNPFTRTTRFDLHTEDKPVRDIQIFNVSGKMVYNESVDQVLTEYSVNENMLGQSGFYVVRFLFDDKFVNRKIYYVK